MQPVHWSFKFADTCNVAVLASNFKHTTAIPEPSDSIQRVKMKGVGVQGVGSRGRDGDGLVGEAWRLAQRSDHQHPPCAEPAPLDQVCSEEG